MLLNIYIYTALINFIINFSNVSRYCRSIPEAQCLRMITSANILLDLEASRSYSARIIFCRILSQSTRCLGFFRLLVTTKL